MKFIAILTLATTALAVPSTLERDPKQECTPPSYACKPNNSGWLVCNVDGKWLRQHHTPAPLLIIILGAFLGAIIVVRERHTHTHREREREEEEEEDCEIASSFVAP
ncbi:hypothetical protein SCUP515_08938 [Seiridium cupressi]